MDNRKIEHYIHLYPGCRIETVDGPGVNLGHYWPDVWLAQGRIEPNGVVVGFPSPVAKKYAGKGIRRIIPIVMNYNQCVLRPTPLINITRNHAMQVAVLQNSMYLGDVNYSKLNQRQMLFLLQNGYDVFGIGNMKIQRIGRTLVKSTKHAKVKRTAKKAIRNASKKKNARNKDHK